MNHRITQYALAALLAGGLMVVALAAGAEMDHAHGEHGHDAPPGEMKPWSFYYHRDNPEPHTEDRFELLPVPGRPGAWVAAASVPEARHCEAILAAEHHMVDKALREACESDLERSPFGRLGEIEARDAGHGGHQDHGGHHGH